MQPQPMQQAFNPQQQVPFQPSQPAPNTNSDAQERKKLISRLNDKIEMAAADIAMTA